MQRKEKMNIKKNKKKKFFMATNICKIVTTYNIIRVSIFYLVYYISVVYKSIFIYI